MGIEKDTMGFDGDRLRRAAAELARRNVFIGTSSWKYPGWLGLIYDEQRYLWRGKVAESRFNRDCLSEYAETFKSVCVDAGYYRFPARKYIEGLIGQAPDDFRFSFKVTDEITIKKFTRLPRFGDRAGKPNENFLNADLFQSAFLAPLEPFRRNAGVLIFEFSRFYKNDFERGREFVEVLDGFLGQLPRDWQYGVEIRNRQFLKPGYFDVLARHGVAHVFNNWTHMPSIGEQMEIPESRTTDFAAARFLLTPGRQYQEAVDLFSPYEKTAAPDGQARKAGSSLLRDLVKTTGRPSFVYVNNRLEGNALFTLMKMVDEAACQS